MMAKQKRKSATEMRGGPRDDRREDDRYHERHDVRDDRNSRGGSSYGGGGGRGGYDNAPRGYVRRLSLIVAACAVRAPLIRLSRFRLACSRPRSLGAERLPVARAQRVRPPRRAPGARLRPRLRPPVVRPRRLRFVRVGASAAAALQLVRRLRPSTAAAARCLRRALRPRALPARRGRAALPQPLALAPARPGARRLRRGAPALPRPVRRPRRCAQTAPALSPSAPVLSPSAPSCGMTAILLCYPILSILLTDRAGRYNGAPRQAKGKCYVTEEEEEHASSVPCQASKHASELMS
jgi:hypothetical protein